MEKAETDLKKVLDKTYNDGLGLNINEFMKLLTNTVHGIFYFHRNNMVHRDIKVDNIMITKK